jgi:hypothetical protein
MIITAAMHAAARLREDAYHERLRSGLPDVYGPVDLPGGGWKLGMEDGSVLIVCCGTGFAVEELSRLIDGDPWRPDTRGRPE